MLKILIIVADNNKAQQYHDIFNRLPMSVHVKIVSDVQAAMLYLRSGQECSFLFISSASRAEANQSIETIRSRPEFSAIPLLLLNLLEKQNSQLEPGRDEASVITDFLQNMRYPSAN